MFQIAYRVLPFLFIFISNPSFAFFGDGIQLNGIVMDFDFSEFNQAGEVVNERGTLNGVELEFGKGFDSLWISAQGSILKGSVVYDGETQAGIPHKTTTNQTIYDYSIQIGRIYESYREHDFATIFFGLGFHQWVRDIETKDNVFGPFERYTWFYANVGARGYIYSTRRAHFMVEINLLRTIEPIMDVSFRGEHDNTRVPLGEHYGARFSLPFRYEITRQFLLYSEIFFEAWDLGQSDSLDLTNEGFVVGGIEEPKSESRFAGIQLGIVMRFD